jgi:cation transport ATPase
MRELTPEQRELMVFIHTPEYLARKAKEQAEARAVMEAARAEAARLHAIQRAQYEKAKREREENIRPLKEALRAAGIQLHVSSYEGVWGSYQIGDGPEVEFDEDGLDTFEED